MIKDAYEDRQRAKQDKAENDLECEACPRGKNHLNPCKSVDLQVGCIVKVKENSNFPADLILLKSSLPRGICYVETKSLDGETNLK